MKKIIPIVIALTIACTSSFAQKKAASKNSVMPGRKTSASTHKTAIGGIITDKYKRPIPEAQAFIYQADSTIIASGNTDSAGYYETNSVSPGKYNLKIVYPSSTAILVKGVVIKSGVTQVSLKMNAPATDTTMLYTDLLPKKPQTPKGAAHKAAK